MQEEYAKSVPDVVFNLRTAQDEKMEIIKMMAKNINESRGIISLTFKKLKTWEKEI